MLPAMVFAADGPPPPNKGDTSWLMTSTVLVILMTIPGLALFYGGMVRSKNVLSLLMQVFIIFCLASIMWAIYGYSVAFTGGDGSLGSFFGGFSRLFLKGVTPDSPAATFSKGVYVPEYAYICFQLTFAAITPALIVGGLAERVKFSALLVFIILWLTFSYYPIAHMVWYWAGPDAYTDAAAGDAALKTAGFLFQKGALDFAGGTVVHINSGIAGLVGCLLLGKRIGYGQTALTPHNVPFTMIGASLLWVGWFGFNVGSNLEANGFAAMVFTNTLLATAAATLAWMLGEWIFKGSPTMLGAASGAVAGLVAITPACGFVSPIGSLIIGVLAGGLCALAVGMKWRFGFDDSLDVVGIHLVGGAFGSIALGFLSLTGGLLYADRDAALLGKQTVAVLAVGAYSFVLAYVIAWVVDKVIGFRVDEDDEVSGIDLAEHAETGYELHPATGGGVRTAASIARPAKTTEESVNA